MDKGKILDHMCLYSNFIMKIFVTTFEREKFEMYLAIIIYLV